MTGAGARLGLVVNPIAGMGGRVGLKGTDSPEIVQEALRLGGRPQAPARATVALEALARVAGGGVKLLAAPGAMGAEAAAAAGLDALVVGTLDSEASTESADTVRSVLAMEKAGVDLIMFAGGDGTARDVYGAVGDRVPTVGIPAGVKMHSAVYATSPRAAGMLAARFLLDGDLLTREAEVMDIDEEAFRRGSVSAELYGYLKVPYLRALVQGAKSGSEPTDQAAAVAVASEVASRVDSERLYVLGPGTTLRAVAAALGVEKTLLGVDLYRAGSILGRDVGSAQVERAVRESEKGAVIIVTPIGGQGHIFGRGNQQISPAAIRAAGIDSIMVVATTTKLAELKGRPLLVDTGDLELDEMMSGYIRVITGVRMESVYRVGV